MLAYQAIKHIHMLAVALSGAFFIQRGVWMLRQDEQLNSRWVKTVPHVLDTILLIAAIALVVVGQWYQSWPSWLLAKFGLLIAYIALGTVGLKRGKTLRQRLIAWVLAIAVFVLMVLVAISKSFPPNLSLL